MTTWAPARRDTLDSLAAEILHNYARGRALVAVDGADDSGMRAFADDLAAAIARAGHGVARASVDDFRIENAVSGSDTAAGRYRGTFDYVALREVLLAPFTAGAEHAESIHAESIHAQSMPAETVRAGTEPAGTGSAETGPAETGQLSTGQSGTGQAEPRQLAPDAILVVDGIFLNRPELRGAWNFSVWLDAGLDESAPATADSAAHALYVAESSPRTRATAIVNNSDRAHPRRVFADSC